MSKKISPVSVWVNGQVKVAEYLDAYGVGFTLGVNAKFFYSLSTKIVDAEGIESSGEQVTSGNLDMVGQDYQDWQQDEFAWDWVANQLNLVILP